MIAMGTEMIAITTNNSMSVKPGRREPGPRGARPDRNGMRVRIVLASQSRVEPRSHAEGLGWAECRGAVAGLHGWGVPAPQDAAGRGRDGAPTRPGSVRMDPDAAGGRVV